MVNVIIPRPGAIFEPPGLWPNHNVRHPQAMLANLRWFMTKWSRMEVGHILSTDDGAYERTEVGWKRYIPDEPLPKPADFGMPPSITVPDDTPVEDDGETPGYYRR